MRSPTAWEDWCDGFWTVHDRFPDWEELLTAVQQDARGEPVEPWEEKLAPELRRSA